MASRPISRLERRPARTAAVALLAAATLVPVLPPPAVGQAEPATSAGVGVAGANPYALLRPPPDDGRLKAIRVLPRGQLRSIGQASELRWVFDRPVVELAAIDQRPDMSRFVSIEPALEGSFRWASTRILVFTPTKRVPRSTAFAVTLQGVNAVDGDALGAPVRSAFETPRVKCELSGFEGGEVSLYCDQPTKGADVAAHVELVATQVDTELAPFRGSDEGGDALNDVLRRLAAKGKDLGRFPTTLVRTARCRDDRRRTCHYVAPAKGSLPPDANVSVVFKDGIVSSEGPLPSQGIQPGSVRTKETPLVGVGCRRACDPEDTWLVTRGAIEWSDVVGHLRMKEVGSAREQTYNDDEEDPWSLSWARIEPQKTYDVSLDAEVVGFPLRYRVAFGPRSAYIDFPSGETVRELDLGATIPVVIRNVTGVEAVVQRITADQLADIRHGLNPALEDGVKPTALGLGRLPRQTLTVPKNDDKGVEVPLRLQGPGVYLAGVRPTGYLQGSVYDSELLPNADASRDDGWIYTLVQVTDLGVSMKTSATNVLIAVRSLAKAAPIGGARVALRRNDTGAAVWSGSVDANGLVIAPNPKLDNCTDCTLVATAENANQFAYTDARWVSGGFPFPIVDGPVPRSERVAFPVPGGITGTGLTAVLYPDRGVYKEGEDVHVRGNVRLIEPRRITLPGELPPVQVTVTDSQGTAVHETTVNPDRRGGFDVVFNLPVPAKQGNYSVNTAYGGTSFLVTAFRRPDFKVDTTIEKKEYVPGDPLKGTVDGAYLFGAPMADREVRWVLTSQISYFDPTDGHPELGLRGYSWTYVCGRYDQCDEDNESEQIRDESLKLDAAGRVTPTHTIAIRPRRHQARTVQLEGIVTNVDRQVIANRAAVPLRVGEFSIGVKTIDYFGRVGRPLRAELAAVANDGKFKADVALTATFVRWEWRGRDDFATPVEVAKIALRSAGAALPFQFTPNAPGSYEIRVEAKDARGNHIEAGRWAYVLDARTRFGPIGSNGIELTPQGETYAVGDTARILVQSPWADAAGFVTVERDDIISVRPFAIAGTAAALDIPIVDEHTPNIRVSVTLYKGRTVDREPGQARPAVITADTSLLIPPTSRGLGVSVATEQASYRPGSGATATVSVRDASGRPVSGRATLWAVDEGVLRLTGYTSPNLLSQFWSPRFAFIPLADNRTRAQDDALLKEKLARDEPAVESAGRSADAAAPPSTVPASGLAYTGDDEAEDEAVTLRTDFRVLAAWVGSVDLSPAGTARVPLTLPQSLSSYRIIAVADSGEDRFGSGDAIVEIRQPFMVQPALPRFVSLGDTFEAGAVLQNQTGQRGQATLTLKLPADSPVSIDGAATQTIDLPVGPTEVRFRLKATRLGVLQATMTGRLGRETDAVQVAFPVLITRRTETVAAAGVVEAGGPPDVEQVRLPGAVYPDLGGLIINGSSSALAGLQNGVADLVEYPYGCLEQRSSRLRVLLMLNDLKQAFRIPALGREDLATAARRELARLAEYETSSGGLSYWPGDDRPDVFLSARVLVLMLDARDLGYTPPPGLIEGVTSYLENSLVPLIDEMGNTRPAVDDSGLWWNRAHVLYALARAGNPQQERAEMLYPRRENLSFLEQSHLLHALVLSGDTGIRANTLYRELLNSVRIEADEAFVQVDAINPDGDDVCPCLAYLFGGGEGRAVPHDSAALLSVLLKVDAKDRLAAQLAKGLLSARNPKGTWGNTLENGYALTSLVEYVRTAEAEVPNNRGQVLLGTVTAFDATFSGRSLAVQTAELPMARLAAAFVDPTKAQPLTVKGTGTGRIYWSARLTYAPSAPSLPALQAGFTVTREYLAYDRDVAATTFKAGQLVRVRLKVRTAQVRRQVAIDDPLPAGLEALNANLASTAQAEVAPGTAALWATGVDHVEMADDRVRLFATELPPGELVYVYVARATAPGTFAAAPTQAEEMYRPEIFGRTASASVVVTP